MKLIDKLLLILIFTSAGFIIYRFLIEPMNVQHPVNPTSSVEVYQSNAAIADFVAANAPVRKHGSIQKLALSLKVSQQLAEFRVQRTSACKTTLYSPIQAYPIYHEEVARHVSTAGTSILVEGGTGCAIQGAEWTVYKVGEKTEDPYLLNLGSSRIVDIFEIPYGKFDESLSRSIGLSDEDRNFAISTPAFAKSNRIVLVSVSKPESPGSSPPGTLPKFPALGQNEVSKWLKASGKKTLIVDVRTNEEIAAEPIKISASIERLPYSTAVPRFSWKKTVGEIESDGLSSSPKFLELIGLIRGSGKDLSVVVVGSDFADGRPIWTMKELGQFGLSNVIWYRDGAKSLNAMAGQ